MARRRWEEISHLNQVGIIRWERREKGGKEKEKKKKEKKRKKKKRGVRSSTLSLRFTEIGPSVFVEARGKVPSTRRELHVGTRIWGFRQTPRGRGFSHILVILGLRAI